MNRLIVVLALAACLAATQAQAWGNRGHMTVGAMADRLIANSRADTEVAALLQPGESLATVAIWADCAKGYCGPLTDEMKAFVQANPKHHDYHFTDVPFQEMGYRLGAVGTNEHDIVQILRQCVSVLKGNPTPATNPGGLTKRQALLMLTHLVGDLHQPLHVGTAYLDGNDNFVVPTSQSQVDDIKVFQTHGDNYLLVGSRALHAYWDTQAVDYAMRRVHAATPQDFASALIENGARPAASVGDPAKWLLQWANEALVVAKTAHQGVVPGDREEGQDRFGHAHFQWSVEVPSAYAKTVSGIAADQIRKAGYRLADLLQAIWP